MLLHHDQLSTRALNMLRDDRLSFLVCFPRSGVANAIVHHLTISNAAQEAVDLCLARLLSVCTVGGYGLDVSSRMHPEVGSAKAFGGIGTSNCEVGVYQVVGGCLLWGLRLCFFVS